MTFPARDRRETELGTEVRCASCGEFWPEDAEFFYRAAGKTHSWCKACYRENPKVVEKDTRWRERQRKNPPPPPPPPIDWAPLFSALLPAPQETSC